VKQSIYYGNNCRKLQETKQIKKPNTDKETKQLPKNQSLLSMEMELPSFKT